MIIRSLRAENLLKYRTLRLDELPEHGVIGVSGDNETGKSAIGEIICFALFGRTYSLTVDDLRKLVRWGAIQGRVTMRFSVKDRDLEISRHLDRGGAQSARLVLSDQPQETLARGLESVNEQMEHLLGCNFGEYIETFYLAQREITTPHPHSPAVRAMAGVVPLEHCAEELRGELLRDEEAASLYEVRIGEVAGELALLRPERLRVGEMEQELENQAQRERELGHRVDDLGAAADAYCTASCGLRSHGFRRGLASLLHLLLLVLLAALAGGWALLRYEPELWPWPAVRERLEGFSVASGLPIDATLVYAAIAVGGMLLLVWLWILALNVGMQRRRARGRRLAEELRLVDDLEPVVGQIEAEIDEDVLSPDEVPVEAAALVDKPDSERRTRLADRARTLEATREDVRAATRHEIVWMERNRSVLDGQRKAMKETLDSARRDRDKGQNYRIKSDELAEQLAECRVRIETRRLACELLDGAAQNMADRFSDHLRNLVSRNLPKFTDGRYEYLQVGDDLQVRVYSNEKRSFLDLEEISSGTQRQITLALRLALAQEQMDQIIGDRQFAFLDEPFAFFDDTRMRGALRLLPGLSDVITQHWVVAQRFPRDEFLALEVPCIGDSDTLEIGRASEA